MSEGTTNLAVAILAGGCGSRIGGRKPLRVLGARLLIDRAVERAQTWSSDVVAIVRHPEQVGKSSCEIIEDSLDVQGPLAALAAGLAWATGRGKTALLTIPCDMPFLPDDLAAHLGNGLGQASVALAASGGHIHPVCGLWKVEVLSLLPDYIATGKSSLKGFAASAGFTEIAWPVAKRDPFFNINSGVDLAAASEMLEI